MKKKVRLTQCMIVKDEEKNIERALSWGKDIVYEQIVVDTGSQDKTMEIAKKMGASVYQFDWINDFSAAKNYAIEQATGNWIAFLDADEYLTSEDAKALMNKLTEIENSYKSDHKPHILRMALVNLNEQGNPSSTSVQDRVFRNVTALRYKNRIHEVLSFPGGRKTLFLDASSQLSVFHTGYTKSAFAEKDKAARNVQLLEEELKEQPGDCVLLSYLGDALMLDQQCKRALEIMQEVVQHGLQDTVEPLCVENACGQLMKILAEELDEPEALVHEWFQKTLTAAPELPDIDFWYAVWMTDRDRWAEALDYMKRALDKLERYNGLKVLNITGHLDRAYCILARACQELGNDPEAVKYMVLALRADRFLESVLTALFDLLKKEPSEQEEANGTFSLLQNLYHMDMLKDKLFVLKCAKLSGFIKIEEKMLGLLTDKEREGLL